VKLSTDSLPSVKLGDHFEAIEESRSRNPLSKTHDLPDLLIDSISDDPHASGRD
jgi:hypothetical protein